MTQNFNVIKEDIKTKWLVWKKWRETLKKKYKYN